VQRSLVLAAIGLVLLSSAGGLMYGRALEHRTLLELREQYQGAFRAAAAGDMAEARAALRAGQRANSVHVRVIDAHTHWIKLATLILMVSAVLPLCGWSASGQRRFAAALLGGAVLFPAGVLLQVPFPGVSLQTVAAVGALLVIGAMVMLVRALFHAAGTTQ